MRSTACSRPRLVGWRERDPPRDADVFGVVRDAVVAPTDQLPVAAPVPTAPVVQRTETRRHRRLARGSSHDLSFDDEVTAGRRSIKRIVSALPDDRAFQGSNS